MSADRSSPQTLDELRALLASIDAADPTLSLGRQAQRALVAMLDDPKRAALESISSLAAAIGVNASTLTRLARRLGYPGFGAFQAVFRTHLSEEARYYSRRADRLLKSSAQTGMAMAMLGQIAAEETTNIQQLLARIAPETLETVAGVLATARRVRVHGLRQMYPVASFLSYALGMLRDDVAVLGSIEHGVGHGLAQLDARDVLVVIGAHPYTRATADAARIATSRATPVVAITDSHGSPLARTAQHTFIVPTGGSFFGNSQAGAMVLCEGLLMVVAWKLGDAAVKALEDREALIKALSIQV